MGTTMMGDRKLGTGGRHCMRDSPEELARSASKAHHVVGDGTKQQGLNQVVRHLNEALGKGKGQFVVHARSPFPVHDAALSEGHRLHRHGIDDTQEQHGQVQTAQNVAQVLRCLPANMTTSPQSTVNY